MNLLQKDFINIELNKSTLASSITTTYNAKRLVVITYTTGDIDDIKIHTSFSVYKNKALVFSNSDLAISIDYYNKL